MSEEVLKDETTTVEVPARVVLKVLFVTDEVMGPIDRPRHYEIHENGQVIAADPSTAADEHAVLLRSLLDIARDSTIRSVAICGLGTGIAPMILSRSTIAFTVYEKDADIIAWHRRTFPSSQNWNILNEDFNNADLSSYDAVITLAGGLERGRTQRSESESIRFVRDDRGVPG